MNKRQTTTLSIAAVIAAAGLALQAPTVGAQSATADNYGSASTAQAADASGVPGVEANVGANASDRGLPGVEMNVGAQGDQQNIDTRTLGAGADTGMTGDESMRAMRADRG